METADRPEDGAAPAVDVVIAVHTPRRRVDRAVASVLNGTSAAVRVTVVAHNTPVRGIRERLGAIASDPRLRVVSLEDGVPSPAGPFNLGLELATAPFTSVMGSDDELEPHAVDSWLAVAGRDRADVVIAHLRHADGSTVPTPPTRPFRRSRLDPVADRLSYRSAPLGIVATSAFGSLRFAEALTSGEDLPYVSRLWFSGRRVSVDRSGPAYVIHADADDRVTGAATPIAEEFAHLPLILDSDWFARLTTAQRSAIVVKFLRIHVFGAVLNRSAPSMWGPDDRAALASVCRRLLSAGSGIERVLSRADRDLLDAVLDETSPPERLHPLAVRRRRRLAPASLLPRRLRYALHREAPLRFSAASALVALGGRG